MEINANNTSPKRTPSKPPGDNNDNDSIDNSNKSSDRCVLCLEAKRAPKSLLCGHTFCEECLNAYRSYRKYPWARRCPLCRTQLRERHRGTKRRSTTSQTPPPTSRLNLNDNPSTTNDLEYSTSNSQLNEELSSTDLSQSSSSDNLSVDNNNNLVIQMVIESTINSTNQELSVNLLPGESSENNINNEFTRFNLIIVDNLEISIELFSQT